ncbi:MAG: hypothetical protein K6G61_00935 [Solobacterium sp.]|nr:hypothetical protein [Solobacterium sp.]
MHKARQIRAILLTAVILLFIAGCSSDTQQEEGGHPFDYYIDCTTKEDIEALSGEAFVKGVFPFTLMTFQRPGNRNPQEGQIAILAAPSFDTIDYSPYNRTCWKKEDPAVLQDHGKNPILIDERLAKAEKLSVGDPIYQETKISDAPLEFTVAGIFRHDPLYAQYEAIALINEQIIQIFSARVDELGYTNAYVSASDLPALQAYLDEDFIPHLLTKGLSEEEIASIPREDLKVYYEDYESHMIRMK